MVLKDEFDSHDYIHASWVDSYTDKGAVIPFGCLKEPTEVA